MQTLRGRLTASYSAALALTLAAFAVLLYLDRRSASYQDLDQRIQSEATLTAGILAESYRARGSLVRADTSGRPVLIADVAGLLEAVPDFLIITARDGSLLFASPDARALTFQQVEQLGRLARAPFSGRAAGTLRLEPDGPLQFGTMTAREFFLYKSQLLRGGARYTKLQDFALEPR